MSTHDQHAALEPWHGPGFAIPVSRMSQLAAAALSRGVDPHAVADVWGVPVAMMRTYFEIEAVTQRILQARAINQREFESDYYANRSTEVRELPDPSVTIPIYELIVDTLESVGLRKRSESRWTRTLGGLVEEYHITPREAFVEDSSFVVSVDLLVWSTARKAESEPMPFQVVEGLGEPEPPVFQFSQLHGGLSVSRGGQILVGQPAMWALAEGLGWLVAIPRWMRENDLDHVDLFTAHRRIRQRFNDLNPPAT